MKTLKKEESYNGWKCMENNLSYDQNLNTKKF